MRNFIRLACFIACAFVFFGPPAHAQDAQNAAPAAIAQPDDAMPEAVMKPHFNPRMQDPGAMPPLPADAPRTEKNGDDLIIHAPGGDITMPGFLRGVGPDEGRPINIVMPGHGNCLLQVDGNGAVATMKCEK